MNGSIPGAYQKTPTLTGWIVTTGGYTNAEVKLILTIPAFMLVVSWIAEAVL